ncbi:MULTISPECIES: hypothetical protein [Amycolatopsis]|uniref:Acyl dehydratase n=2 Tax=Amycolatopsis TaxID=1813 RepID=A0A1I3KDA9_9PSEU|nr:hypothetical protein [Amycolatopsis sacchari]SFI70185.1 hypothetical protein SAMN05421835_101503 [Amycolatopsis sacchari]
MSTRPPARFEDIAFAELRVGKPYRTSYELGLDLVAAFRAAAAPGRNQIPHVGELVPPAVYSTFRPMFEALGGRMEQGTIHTHQSVTVATPPARAGDVLDVEVTVVRAEETADRRRLVEVATEYRHEGRRVCSTRSRYLWGFSAAREDER